MADPVSVRILQRALTVIGTAADFYEVLLLPPGDPAGFPAAHLIDEGEEVLSEDPFAVRSRLQLAVIGFAAGRTDALLQARALDAAVVARMLDPAALAGLATLVNLGALTIEPVELSDVRAIGWRRDFSIEYTFRTTNPAETAG